MKFATFIPSYFIVCQEVACHSKAIIIIQRQNMHYTTPLLMLLVASSSLAAPPQKTLPQKALPQKASPAHPSPSPSKAVGTPTNQRLPPYKVSLNSSHTLSARVLASSSHLTSNSSSDSLIHAQTRMHKEK